MWTLLKRKFWQERDDVVSEDGFTFTTTRVPTVRRLAKAALGTAFIWTAFMLVMVVIALVWRAAHVIPTTALMQ